MHERERKLSSEKLKWPERLKRLKRLKRLEGLQKVVGGTRIEKFR
jgi:hypothetical protein